MAPRESLDKILKSFRLAQEEQLQAQISIESNAYASIEYLFFILLSAVVATLGLITGSAPVIIGAMVLAPLMNPVLGISMGVVRGDLSLLGRGLRTLVLGLVLGFLVASVVTSLIPELVLNDEIRGRTQPTLYDLFIGMAAGAGGALAQARKSVAGVLPGAAIAVSLMPPLCVTGVGLSVAIASGFQAGLPIFYGSVLLWMANLAAINLAAIAVFLTLGFRGQRHDEHRKDFRRQLTLSVILVVLLTIPLVHFLRQTIADIRLDRRINEVTLEFARQTLYPDAAVLEVRRQLFDPAKNWTPLFITISSPKLPSRQDVLMLKQELEVFLGPVELNLTVNPVHQYKENAEEGSISDRPRPLDP